MLVNSDFSQRAIVTPDKYCWVASPQPGVTRVMLDRVGAEVARATSIVRYAQDSRFPGHAHPGGEEILVLSGVFSDEKGDYPAGWYLRNPPGSAHRPSSNPGATILVKLHQMSERECVPIRINTRDPARWSLSALGGTCALFSDGVERVVLERVAEGGRFASTRSGGAEIFVVGGELASDYGVYTQGSWLRLPPGDDIDLRAGDSGATLYIKTGHLRALVGSA